ncbi:hypothetical protein BST63_16820 [Bradyrhizobium canariense]|uniref:Uncharacterized protein n=1 Tax=Bradyrhizobium canariense TaxID=255045 RepID=A0ABX3X2J3_9BRAD|nr:hypothetical protein [Bradyrhizobium canariense]OSJ14401.1 hypothetical protein BSR47_18990 [Bradyrhizobium canariense]OSJ28406.1 hypothetical protein BST63_16820 [Bradyrhizobium canariense]
MDEFVMLVAELDRCKAEFQHLQNELNPATGAGPTDIAALQDAARRISGIAARLEAVTRAISKGTASGVH